MISWVLTQLFLLLLYGMVNRVGRVAITTFFYFNGFILILFYFFYPYSSPS